MHPRPIRTTVGQYLSASVQSYSPPQFPGNVAAGQFSAVLYEEANSLVVKYLPSSLRWMTEISVS